MKKLFFAISIAVLFLASCNFDGAKNINRAGTTSVEVPVYNFLSGILLEQTAATAGTTGAIGSTETSGTSSVTSNNEYSVKISFEGNVPDGAVLPEEIKGSKLEDFYGKTFSVKNIPVGAEVQFKITVSDNGGELYEGFSKVVKIKSGVQNIAIAMKRAVDYMLLWNWEPDVNDRYEKHWYAKNRKNTFDSYEMDWNQGIIPDFITDKDGNIYVVEDRNDESEGFVRVINRYSASSGFKKKTTVAVFEEEKYPRSSYDSSTDTLYAMSDFDGIYDIYSFQNVSKVTEAKRFPSSDKQFTPYDHNVLSFAVFKDSLYILDTNNIYSYDYNNLKTEYDGDPEIKSVSLHDVIEDLGINTIDYGREEFNDFAVNDKGVYVLFANHNLDKGDDALFSNSIFVSRGGVLKFDHNLKHDSIIGFSKNIYRATLTTSNGTLGFDQRIPNGISKGFYGPQKIYAIKEKELVFLDGGAWFDLSKPAKGGIDFDETNENHIVTLNLERMSWTAESVDYLFSNHILASQFNIAALEFASGTGAEVKWENGTN